jgi:hypothetical protein
MCENFEVGEIAIVHHPGSRFHGDEVTIMGPLEMKGGTDIESFRTAGPTQCHRISHPIERTYCGVAGKLYIPVYFLRKKKPPKEPLGDWSAMPFYVPPSRIKAHA